MITVLNLGISNIGSVIRALHFLKIPHEVVDHAEGLKQAKKIMLPGVGSFSAGSKALREEDRISIIRKKVLEDKVPFFGICLGMQLIFSQGSEGGTHEGLNLIKGEVVPLGIDATKYSLTHIGWNDVKFPDMNMFSHIPKEDPCFYFVHSYKALVKDFATKIAYTNYGANDVVASVEKENIWGVQFHAERSQKLGLQVLKNFQDLPC